MISRSNADVLLHDTLAKQRLSGIVQNECHLHGGLDVLPRVHVEASVLVVECSRYVRAESNNREIVLVIGKVGVWQAGRLYGVAEIERSGQLDQADVVQAGALVVGGMRVLTVFSDVHVLLLIEHLGQIVRTILHDVIAAEELLIEHTFGRGHDVPFVENHSTALQFDLLLQLSQVAAGVLFLRGIVGSNCGKPWIGTLRTLSCWKLEKLS